MNSKFLTMLFLAIIFSFLHMTLSYARAFGRDSTPENINTSTGGFVFSEWRSNDYYLGDTRSGRVWKAIGEIKKFNRLVPVFYENSKGQLIAQPENDKTNYFQSMTAK